jgi:hydroxymethylglutaryl-CoA lyase
MPEAVEIVETPRDAFQGFRLFVPTAEKIRYIRALMAAGFRHIDLGTLGRPEQTPQLADTLDVIRALQSETHVGRRVLVMEEKGLEQAFAAGGLDGIGFSFSLSSQFQLRQTKTTEARIWPLMEKMVARVEQHDMSFILYLSMAFGNPFGEKWSEQELFVMIRNLCGLGVRHISLADTVAAARPEQVRRVFQRAAAQQPNVRFSAHFHGLRGNWFECVQAALESGCTRFDATIGGLGGTPLAPDALVANIPSDQLALRLGQLGYRTGIDPEKTRDCVALARELQRKYAR